MTRAQVGVLISGGGSNMQALVEATRGSGCPYEVALVVSNTPDAPGLARAERLGVPALALDHRPFGKDREAHERAVHSALRDAGVGWVALAGYMRVFTPWFVQAWTSRMLNIHPSLLPAFPGLHPQAQALAAGVAESGCTVHLVTEGVDAGPILGQARVPVLPGDTEATLAARILAEEHRLYPEVLARVVRGA